MTADDIIRIAREAGLRVGPSKDGPDDVWGVGANLERFATLVIANHPPQSFMTWQEGYEAGKQAERMACAELCIELAPSIKTTTAYKVLHEAARAIQSRGKA